MKTIQTILAMVTCVATYAQPYGQTQYPNSSIMTSGERTGLNIGNEGFLMAGMKGIDFHIDKTTIGGVFSYPNPCLNFEVDYSITENNGCLSTNNLVTTCVGIRAIETTRQPWYAAAGAYDEACFIAFINCGNVDEDKVYPFVATATYVSKPCIAEDHGTNELYLCGAYNSYLYVIKTDPHGAVIWSSYYDVNGTIFEARDVIVSSQTGEVVIVGHVTPDPKYGLTSDCFFLALNPSNGNVNTFKDYSSTPCNWFNSVDEALCPLGGQGYIVGGYTDYTNNNGHALMMKLDQGGNIIWNTLITAGSSGIFADEIKGVVERRNTTGNYYYYGVAQSYDVVSAWPSQIPDLTVFKLDANGNPASGGNEYHYAATLSSPLYAINLSAHNGLPPGDEGLHVYANNGGDFYLLEGYFNGITGCSNESFSNIVATEIGPTDINPTITKFGSFTDCVDLVFTQTFATNSPNLICTGTSVGGGSNARPAPTALAENGGVNPIKLYPNPSSGMYTLSSDSDAELKVYNVLGVLIQQTNLFPGDNHLDLRRQEAGIYYLNLTSGGETKIFKVVKE